MAQIRETPKDLRIFAGGFGVIFQIFALVSWYKGGSAYPYLSGFGIAFASIGLAFPNIYKPIFRKWMAFAGILGRFQTKLLLAIIFYLVITPIAVVLKIFGIDTMHRKLDPEANTYWHERDPLQPPDRFEKQF